MALALASRIDAVTVYRRGAQVRRVAELPPGALPETVTLGGLPLSLEDGSVRVRVEGAGPGGPVARDARVSLEVSGSAFAAAPPDEEALRGARRDEARAAALLAQIRSEADRVARLSIPARPRGKKGEPPPPSPTDARLALLETRRVRTEALLDEARRLEHHLRRLRERRVDLEERWRKASTAREPKRDELKKALVVTIGKGDQASPDRGRLVIEYTVPGALWAPAYSVRIAKDGKRAELAVRAVVCQKSGEDWIAVPVSLSTADTQRFTTLPELSSLRIGRVQRPAPRRGWRPVPPGAEELYTDYDRAFPELPVLRSVLSEALEAADDGITTVTAVVDMPVDAVTRAGSIAPAGTHAGLADVRARLGKTAAVSSRASTVAGMGGAPAAGPMSAAAPMAPQGMAMKIPASETIALGRKKGGVFGGLFESGEVTRDARAESTLELQQEAAVVAEDRMLVYADLRMPGPEQPGRGKLVLASRQETYVELMVSQKIRITGEMLATVDRELEEARQVADLPPPPRHRIPSGQGGFDYAYRGDAPVDVPSDGHFHAIPLTSSSADIELRHVVVPRESQDVFRIAEIPNPLDAPLLEGPADVYLGADYLLTTDLRVTPPKGKLRLGLGVDPAVKASRNTTFAEQSTGLMKGSLALRHGIEVEIVNHRKDAADVEVRERIPTLREREEDIEIELGEVEPPWEPYEQEEQRIEGGQRWRVQVAPGERRRLRASYVVKIASKNELVGGNRRDR